MTGYSRKDIDIMIHQKYEENEEENEEDENDNENDNENDEKDIYEYEYEPENIEYVPEYTCMDEKEEKEIDTNNTFQFIIQSIMDEDMEKCLEYIKLLTPDQMEHLYESMNHRETKESRPTPVPVKEKKVSVFKKLSELKR